MKSVTIHSDGACQGNPGPGGWAAILECGARTKELSGGEPLTTNNRMELQAAIAAFTALKEPCQVEFHTDSKYVQNGISKWVANWKRNGWKTQAKEPVKNEDHWRALDEAVRTHKVTWHWVKGHAGHDLNERCDILAKSQIGKFKMPNAAPVPAAAPPKPA
jgi:ribonuclease HI